MGQIYRGCVDIVRLRNARIMWQCFWAALRLLTGMHLQEDVTIFFLGSSRIQLDGREKPPRPDEREILGEA